MTESRKVNESMTPCLWSQNGCGMKIWVTDDDGDVGDGDDIFP